MNDILEKICADTRLHVEQAKARTPFEQMHRDALRVMAPRGFASALRAKSESEGAGYIAEIKKASPSAGLIRPTFSPKQLAQNYAEGGAACLSVLTEPHYFQGSAVDLVEARSACKLPVLRKDFMLDVWQVAEARAMGADCILVIMAAVDDATAMELHNAATGYGMDVLIEAHDRDELKRALKLPSRLIGINSRNLKTLKIDLHEAEELIKLVPLERFAISESGIHSGEDVARMKAAGARGFLVGESLLKQEDPGAALSMLRRSKANA
ncbi:MAG: indole-3-glycerol phosphate synthase TrpC [Alphaproteobacteria bacterium]|nr:indole-3-glycerol phosphate synthase TrpC [Alphaproteobacteria bacterium]